MPRFYSSTPLFASQWFVPLSALVEVAFIQRLCSGTSIQTKTHQRVKFSQSCPQTEEPEPQPVHLLPQVCTRAYGDTCAFCMRSRRSIIASVLDRMENKMCDTAGRWSKVSHFWFPCLRFTGCLFSALLRAMFPPSSTNWRMFRMLFTLLQHRDTETFSRKNKIEKLQNW